MTFFEHQAAARRNTRVMVVLFLLAVVAVVLAVDLVVGAVWLWANDAQSVPPPAIYVLGALGTAALIFIVSAVNVLRLSRGGAAVAKMVGARAVGPDTTDPLERRLRNVVEEMAIASGVRVPEVYVMDEEGGLNAFAAGWNTSTAAVAVTRGMLETLTRDELQGVVAHEFSHVLNGDMRLNIRMMAVLAGIVFIGSVGEFLMRSARGSRDAKGFFLAGLAVFLIGYIGLFFARLIKSAVSRQREFLADASSVQFTRNPDGIAGALDQIRSAPAGTLIANRYAEEMSHMFFGQSVKMWFGGLFATHPPIEERIRRVQPRFEPSAYRAGREEVLPSDVQAKGRRGGDIAAHWGRTPADSAALVGTFDAGNIDYAARILNALPVELRTALRDAEGARATMLALLLAEPEAARAQQLAAITAKDLAQRALGLMPHTRSLGAAFRLPVTDLALAAVKNASIEAKSELLGALESAVNADRRVSLHEFVVLTLVRDQLAPPAAIAQNRRLAQLNTEAATMLALVAHCGAGANQQALKEALQAGIAQMAVPAVAPELTLETVRNALEALRRLAPAEKETLVKGLFAAVTHDGTIRVAEAELMRVVGAVLDCPLPPLFDSLDPATLAA